MDALHGAVNLKLDASLRLGHGVMFQSGCFGSRAWERAFPFFRACRNCLRPTIDLDGSGGWSDVTNACWRPICNLQICNLRVCGSCCIWSYTHVPRIVGRRVPQHCRRGRGRGGGSLFCTAGCSPLLVSGRGGVRRKQWWTTNTHTRLRALCPGLPGWAGTRKVKPIWILLKQETVSGSGISWDICKSATRSRQITMPAPHHSVSYRPDALPAAQRTASEHWWQKIRKKSANYGKCKWMFCASVAQMIKEICLNCLCM